MSTNLNSYRQITRTTAIMGSVAIAILFLGMLRTKFGAVLIGPVGIGMIANFTAIIGIVGAFAGMGIQASGVREISSAYGRQDDIGLGQTVMVLRRLCWITGLVGFITMVLISTWLSRLSFGSDAYVLDIAVLGLVVFMSNLQSGQTALIHGSRRITDMAKGQIVSGVSGTLIALIFYHRMGSKGIVPALVLMAAVQLIISIYYVRQIKVRSVEISWIDSLHNARSLLKLGMALMWSGVLGSATLYGINALITNQFGLREIGIYSAAFTISGMSVSFILSAMAADYYPRLAGSAQDSHKLNRLVNEQTEIGILLSLPVILLAIAMSDWAIGFFYSNAFAEASILMRWMLLGCLGRIISWPLGYVMIALSKGRWYFFTETTFNFLHLLFVLIGLNYLGIKGAAIAFFIMYVGYAITVHAVASKITKFCWTKETKQLITASVIAAVIMFLIEVNLKIIGKLEIKIFILSIVSSYCLNELLKRLTNKNLFHWLFKKLRNIEENK